ncbi:MAG: flagellin [Burkholderiales bacterium]|nr:flagellin [Burkholderiales bacterium]
MPQIINTNVASLNAQRNLNSSQSLQSMAIQRLSSGLRINSAKDDAAGLAISERFTSQIRGLDQATRNANDGISLAQTAEGGLSTLGDLLQRMRELAVQSANSTNSSSDRGALQAEVSQLQQEINRVATTTQFNGLNLLDGTLGSAQFQVGANANQTINLSISDVQGGAIGNYGYTTAATAGTSVEAAAAGTDASTVTNRVAQQTLQINGNGQSASVSVGTGASAKAVADLVNAKTGTTGVSATASTYATLGGLQLAGTLTFSLQGNGNAVSIGVSVGSTSDLSSVAQAINAQSATTGITASATGGTVQLTSRDGYDIKIADFSNSSGTSGTITLTGTSSSFTATGAGATLGAAATSDTSVVGGQVTFNSNANFTVNTSAGSTLFGASGAQQAAGSLATVSNIDISSVNGANAALQTIDSALQTVNSVRAQLGAVQNRFVNTISNLQITSENLASSRSRIMDADFASETAKLTRANVLQQAGTAMLAQANALPNNVLALLRG